MLFYHFFHKNIILNLEITPELKKEGDYRELTRKIKDLRKENNLVASDVVSLLIKTNSERKAFIESFKEELIKDCKLSDIKFEESQKEEIILIN